MATTLETAADDPQQEGAPAFFLLGDARWQAPDGTGRRLSAKDAALIALLSLEGPRARGALAGWLWPTADESGAAMNLRQRIMRLRQDTGHALFVTGKTLSLLPEVVLDVGTISAASAQEVLAAGELLAGYEYPDNEQLESWVQAQRLRMRRERAERLAAHAHDCEGRGELVAALRFATLVTDLAPLQEHGWRRLMRLHHLRGDRTAAIDAFVRLEALLREETGVGPGAETIELLTMVESAEPAGTPQRRPVPASLTRPPRLIGRDREWRQMEAAWAYGQPFLLLGDAGLGKSRLLGDFVMGRMGIRQAQGRPGDAQVPYAVLGRLLQSVTLGFSLALEPQVAAELARLDPELGMAPGGPAEERVLWHAVERAIGQALQAGLAAVVVDDLHWADLATVEALRWLAGSPRLARLRFGFAARPHEDAAIGRLLRDWQADHARPVGISLAPLAVADVRTLLDTLRLPRFPATAWAARLHQRAGGHPLFTLESLKDAFLLDTDPDTTSMTMPETVQAVLERRLHRLTPAALELVRVAAVAGADLTADIAAQLLHTTPIALSDAWRELEDAGVLQGEHFAHELVRESTLRLVPKPVAKALHAALAQRLAGQGDTPAGRMAWHWEAAERWSEAGSAWQQAAAAARRAGRLDEQAMLLRRAAECYARVHDVRGQAASLLASLEGLQFRHGGGAVLAVLPSLDELPLSAEERLRRDLAHAEALVDLERTQEALAVIEPVVARATDHSAHLGDALCLQGMALAQSRRIDEAIELQRRATAAAQAHGSAAQRLRTTGALAYVLYAGDRVAEAIAVQEQALGLAVDLNDSAEVAAAEGNLAAMEVIVGDTAIAYRHAKRVRQRYLDLGMADDSTLGLVNLIVLGQSAASLGRLDEALDALKAAVALSGERAAVNAQAKARIALSALWITLGCGAHARELLDALPEDMLPGMHMQACLHRAQIDRMEGGDGAADLERLGALMAGHPNLPYVQSAWIEWSWQGDAAEVVTRLAAVRAALDAAHMHGAARSLRVCEIARTAELDNAHLAAQAAHDAATLRPYVATGLSPRMYPPQTWLVLSEALARGGDSAGVRGCLEDAARWLREQALAGLAPALHARFLLHNAVNREVLARVG